MKRYGLLLVLCLFSCASSNGSSIESSLSISSEIDYGTIILRLDEDVLEGEVFNSKDMRGHIELYRKD